MAIYNIFLSYSRQDAEIMKFLRYFFQQNDFTLWTDEGIEPGTDDWQTSIEQGIQNSDCLICLLSPDAKKSKWVKAELWRAEQFDLPIFLIIVRGTELEAIPLGYEYNQFVDLRRTKFEEYPKKLSILVDTLGKFKRTSDREGSKVVVKASQQVMPTITFLNLKQRIDNLGSLDFARNLTAYLTSYIKQFIPEPFELIHIPEHNFELMRGSRFANQSKTHVVNMSQFFIAKFPVTVGQFIGFLESPSLSKYYFSRPIKPDALFIDKIVSKKNTHYNHPVTGVSWYDAVAFIDWLSTVTQIGFSLPYEIQWLNSCGSKELLTNNSNVMPSINSIRIPKSDYHKGYVDGILETHPVVDGITNILDVVDGIGNAWEWCEDNNPHVYRTFMTDSTSRFSGVKFDPLLNNVTEKLIALWGGYVLEHEGLQSPRVLKNRPQINGKSPIISPQSFRTTSRVVERNSTFGFRLCIDISSIKKIFLS